MMKKFFFGSSGSNKANTKSSSQLSNDNQVPENQRSTSTPTLKKSRTYSSGTIHESGIGQRKFSFFDNRSGSPSRSEASQNLSENQSTRCRTPTPERISRASWLEDGTVQSSHGLEKREYFNNAVLSFDSSESSSHCSSNASIKIVDRYIDGEQVQACNVLESHSSQKSQVVSGNGGGTCPPSVCLSSLKMMIKFTLLLTFFILVTFATNEAGLKVKGEVSGEAVDMSGLEKMPDMSKQSEGEVSGEGVNMSGLEKMSDMSKQSEGEVSGEGVNMSGLEKMPDMSKQSEGHDVEAESNVEKKTSENTGKKVDKKDGDLEELGDKGKSKEVFPGVRKENEECGLPDRCTAENDALVACLRVPGNESPELALLIQNNGKGPLDVKIIAPSFVSLEKQQIHLVENKHERVKVTVKNGGTDNLIILTAGNGNCTLSFKDLITQNLRKESVHTSQLNRSTYFTWKYLTTAVLFIILTAILMLASVWTCISFLRRHYPSNSSKYQKLDMELPVSDGAKIDTELHAGWDDSWGDSWDDEEAAKTPKTPSMPITPSFSSQGVFSRTGVSPDS